ncbi:LysB family phage lysis regulatory protein [Paraburkholderia graminis]|uniref:LysB family phage lysis regulatory protein n=1 Tax=Paraburkholderia graminis TaxID=60548 RepID=UPI0038BC97FE
MSTIAARLIAIALAALAAFGAWQYVSALRAELATVQETARTEHETVGRRDATIADLQKRQRDDALALAQLERTRQGIAADLAARKSELETLKRENETVRAWADGALPDDVKRLYANPALTGAVDAAMRAGNGLHAAGDGAAQ